MKNAIQKISVLGFAMLSLSISAQAQWTRNAATLQTYLTNTGDNVGIGTTNPQFKLDVQSNSAASMSFKSTTGNSNIIIDRANSASTSGVNYRTNGVPFWQTGTIGTDNYVIRNINLGTSAFVVNYSTNNVGIGTANTPYKLTINSSSAAIGLENRAYISAKNTLGVYEFHLWPCENDNKTYMNHGSGGFDIRNHNGVTTMYLSPDHKVGIRTNTPIGALGVVGTDGGNTVATFGFGSAGISLVQDWPGVYFNSYYNSNTKSMAAGYGGIVAVDPTDGHLGIILASAAATAPGQAMTFSNGTQLVLTNTGDLTITGNMTAQDGDIYLGPLNGTINAGGGLLDPLVNMMTDFDNHAVVNGDEDLYVGDALEVGTQAYKPGGGSWTTISDARLKKDVKNYNDGLEELMKINPVTFKYNDKVKFLNPDKEYVGIIAQEMQKIAPYMVEEKALFSKSHEDKDGNVVVDEAGQNYLTYDGSALTYMLVNAVKEQNGMIEKVQTENEALKQQLKEMQECVQSLCENSIQSKTSNPEPQSANQLFQNQPNPFNQSTIIRYQLMSGDANAKIIIRDLSGNLAKQVAIVQSGKGQISINANELTQGTYTYTLEVNGVSVDTKLMVLVK